MQWKQTGVPQAEGDLLPVALDANRILLAGDRQCFLFEPKTFAMRSTRGLMSHSRRDHALITLPDGHVLALGGRIGTSKQDASAELFDPASETWRPAPSLRLGREHCAAVLAGDRVFAIGGYADGGAGAGTVEAWRPGETEWATLPSLPEWMTRPRATRFGTGAILVTGGEKSNLWDPGTDSWSSVALSSRHAGVVPWKNGVAILGGTYGRGFSTSGVQLWSPDAGRTLGKELPTERGECDAVLLGDGRIGVIGGNKIDTDETGGEMDIEYRSATWSSDALASIVVGSPETGWTRHDAPAIGDCRAFVLAGEWIVAVTASTIYAGAF